MSEPHDDAGDAYLEHVFGEGGILSSNSATYKKRQGQITMTRSVHEAIVNDVPLLAEAATGTGKSFGYLIPAIRAVTDEVTKAKLLERRTPADDEKPTFKGSTKTCEESPRVLIVTAGLSLQDQLVNKDLPFLRKILPWPFQFQAAKGKSNYACLSRLHETNVFEIDDRDVDQWEGIQAWVKTSATGDVAELPFEINASLKRHVSVSADECHGSHCAYFRECYAVRARERAGQSEIVVANFHLLLSHLAVAKAGDPTSIIPRYDVLVLDEVHELPAIARKFLGFHIRASELREPLKLLSAKKPVRIDAEREIDSFFGTIGTYRKSAQYKARLRDAEVFAYKPLTETLVRFAEALQRDANAMSDDEGVDESTRREQNELRKAASKLKENAKDIERACLLEESDKNVYFIGEEKVFGHERYAICGEPIDPAGALRAMIWKAQEPKAPEKKDTNAPDEPLPKKRHLPIAIGASATLSTQDSGDEKAVGFMAARLGAEEAKRVVIKTPFAIGKQVLTIYPNESPDAKAKDYAERLVPLIVRILRMSKGRTLGLFTSKRNLDVATALVRKSIGDEYPILKQGDAPRVKLVEQFRRDIPSCLFGVKSFWAGVDVPGEALSTVFIDKIPFEPPDDPVLDALSAKDPETFLKHAIPRAALDLRQAFGRLVRSETDRGVVVLLDRRFVATGWGKILVRALPSTAVSMDLNAIASFFGTNVAT